MSPTKRKKKRTGTVEFSTEFCQTFNVNTNTQIFHKVETEGTLPNLFYKATVTLIHKDVTKKETYRPISVMNTGEKSSIKYLQTEPKST